MGSRRSRHNKGRKPFYKDHRATTGRGGECQSSSILETVPVSCEANCRPETLPLANCNGGYHPAIVDRSLSNLSNEPATLAGSGTEPEGDLLGLGRPLRSMSCETTGSAVFQSNNLRNGLEPTPAVYVASFDASVYQSEQRSRENGHRDHPSSCSIMETPNAQATHLDTRIGETTPVLGKSVAADGLSEKSPPLALYTTTAKQSKSSSRPLLAAKNRSSMNSEGLGDTLQNKGDITDGGLFKKCASSINCMTTASQSRTLPPQSLAVEMPLSDASKEAAVSIALEANVGDSSARENVELGGLYLPYWSRPAGLEFIARRCARRALAACRRRLGRDCDSEEDVAQEIIVRLFSIDEFKRPKTENEYEVWALESAYKITNVAAGLAGRQVSVGYGDGGDFLEQTLIRYNKVVRPNQEDRVFVLDVLRKIGNLPDDMQEIVRQFMHAESAIGFAKDHDVSIFDAMNMQNRVKEVMNRIMEDGAADLLEKSFQEAPHAARP